MRTQLILGQVKVPAQAASPAWRAHPASIGTGSGRSPAPRGIPPHPWGWGNPCQSPCFLPKSEQPPAPQPISAHAWALVKWWGQAGGKGEPRSAHRSPVIINQGWLRPRVCWLVGKRQSNCRVFTFIAPVSVAKTWKKKKREKPT